MPGAPAFQPYYNALRKLKRAATVGELAEMTGRNPESVSNAFGTHLRKCRENGITPMVVKISNGIFAVNTELEPAPPKHHEKPVEQTKPEDDLFEYVTTTKAGTIMVRSANTGTVYALKELDF